MWLLSEWGYIYRMGPHSLRATDLSIPVLVFFTFASSFNTAYTHFLRLMTGFVWTSSSPVCSETIRLHYKNPRGKYSVSLAKIV